MKIINKDKEIKILIDKYNKIIKILEKLFYLINDIEIKEQKLISYSFLSLLDQYWLFIQNNNLINLFQKIKEKNIVEFSFLKMDFNKKQEEWNKRSKNLNLSKKDIYELLKNLEIETFSNKKKLINSWKKELINLKLKI